MKFGLLYELQLPRPWDQDAEARLFREALEEVEIADRLGFDCLWANEHHFLEEYSHSSAPEVFLAACAARTKRIHLGHAVALSPPGYNHPARVAERISTLDLVSEGRVEWGTGESASRMEIEGFNIDFAEKKQMWAEATEQTANMMVCSPYPGFRGKYFSMPCRNVVPKPMQKPHPPIWVACSRRETIHAAARAGIGALAFAFVDPKDAAKWADEYYAIIKSDQCVPIGHSVNANIAMVTAFSCHPDEQEARRRGLESFQFFGYALGHYYVYGQHKPGYTGLWDRFQVARPELADLARGNGIGTPEQIRARIQEYQDAGVDQVIFIQQCGKTDHNEVTEGLTRFANEVMPHFKRDLKGRESRKQAELDPYIRAALARKKPMASATEDEAPVVMSYGRAIAEPKKEPEAYHLGTAGGFEVPSSDAAERKEKAARPRRG